METLDALTVDDLRTRRLQVRRACELARLRARQGGDSPSVDVDALEGQVRALTDELIRRYAADLSLVDSLLDPAYPAGGTAVGRAAP